MDKCAAKEVILKILHKDYERWIQYADECIPERKAYSKSFHCWKEDKGLIEEDAEILSTIFG